MADADELADATEVPAQRPHLRFTWLALGLVVVVIATGSIWWATHRSPDLSIGSKHRVAVLAHPVARGDCWNNIGGVKIGRHYWWSDDHAPDGWGTDPVPGTFLITAAPTEAGPSAVFTADSGYIVAFSGGFPPPYFSQLTCVVS
jgi:hypothetical protein